MIDFDDEQAEMPDIAAMVTTLADAVRNAECCETFDDFKANIDEAIANATMALAALKNVREETRRKAKKEA